MFSSRDHQGCPISRAFCAREVGIFRKHRLISPLEFSDNPEASKFEEKEETIPKAGILTRTRMRQSSAPIGNPSSLARVILCSQFGHKKGTASAVP